MLYLLVPKFCGVIFFAGKARFSPGDKLTLQAVMGIPFAFLYPYLLYILRDPAQYGWRYVRHVRKFRKIQERGSGPTDTGGIRTSTLILSLFSLLLLLGSELTD